MKSYYLLALLVLLISCDQIPNEQESAEQKIEIEQVSEIAVEEEEKEEIPIVTEATLPDTRVIDPNLIGTWVGDEVTYTLEKDGNAKEILDQNGSVVVYPR
jgi:hypothetical protein